MGYFGKVLGGIAGAATGRWWLALLGIVLGHQFDRGFERRAGTRAITDGEFHGLLFAALGAIAKADGVVRQTEIDAARKLMHALALSADASEAAIAAFRRGKQADFNLNGAAEHYVRSVRPDAELRRLMLRFALTAIVDADSMSRPVRAKLWELAQALDVGRVELVQIEAVLRAEVGINDARRDRANEASSADAYQILELPRSASNKDIKRAYRRLMNRHHPDKVAGKGAGAGEVEKAEDRSREIIRAYETLRRQRGFK